MYIYPTFGRNPVLIIIYVFWFLRSVSHLLNAKSKTSTLEGHLMPAHSKFQEKVDVLDLIIEVLKDHEENLSGIIGKFDEIHREMDAFAEKLGLLDRLLERLEGLKVKNVVEATGINGPLAKVGCNDWTVFRAASRGALLVTFEVSEEQVTISSITDLFVFTYSDGILELMRLIGEGPVRWIREVLKNGKSRIVSSSSFPPKSDEFAYETVVKPEVLRRWLSSELGVPQDKIVHGRVLC